MINVKDFGAKGDGVTDDTAAIQAAYAHAAQLMGTPGGAGVVYFPESSGFYCVSNLTIPSMTYGQGWLTSLFDNGLYVSGSIYPGTANAFIGRTSNYAALGGSFVWGPFAEWQKQKYSTPGPVVDMQGVNGCYFEGINFANASGFPTAVHMHNNAAGSGCVYNTFNRCLFIGNLLIDYVAPNNAGFSLRMNQCSVNGTIDMSYFGDVAIRDSFVTNIIARQSTGGIYLQNILSESLNGTDFFEWHGPYSDVLVMDNVGVADSVNSYLIKLVHDPLPEGQQWSPHIKVVNCEPGMGIINPSAAYCTPGIWAEGPYSDISNMQGQMYSGLSWHAKNGLQLYGSQWLPNPLTLIKGNGTIERP